MALSVEAGDWFLDSRNNTSTSVYPYTVNNRVEYLIDGSSYMGKLFDLLSSAGQGDFFYYAGWELNLDLRLVCDKNESEVRKVFRSARERGVDVRVMLSDHFSPSVSDLSTNPNHRADREFRKMSLPIECIIDSRIRYFGSAHQKFSVLLTDGSQGPVDQRTPEKRLHAFCGGIDLQFDRYDDGTHSKPPCRQVKDFPGGWHDVHTHIQGLACVDLAFMFRERWNNPAPTWLDDLGPYSKITQAVPLSATPAAGNHSVQLLRTYPCGYNRLEYNPILNSAELADVAYPFAPQGEFSAAAACLKAIGMAQDFIYIEDQYFFSFQIAQALLNAMIARPKLQVIVLVAQEPSGDPGTSFENFYHHQTLQGLMAGLAQAGRGQNFAIYDLRNPSEEQIYVHAKLMIVDDIWVEIGSMNCNRRSMTHDLEAAIAVVDGDVETVSYGSYGVACKFARELRLNLWAEHLRLLADDPQIDNPVTGFDTWADRASKKSGDARVHAAAQNRKEAPWIWQLIGDPQGTCAGIPAIPIPWPKQ